MRCGQHGCPCTTCEKCGYDYPCRCELLEKLNDLKTRVGCWMLEGEESQAPGFLREAMKLLDEFAE